MTVVTRGGHRTIADLRILGRGDAHAEVGFTSTLDALDAHTLILVTTKAYDAAPAVQGLLDSLRQDTTLLCLQNGLRVEDDIRQVVRHRCSVLRAITYLSAHYSSRPV